MKNTYTYKGFVKDMARLRDKAAIRLINILDKLSGKYEAPVRSNTLHRGN